MSNAKAMMGDGLWVAGCGLWVVCDVMAMASMPTCLLLLPPCAAEHRARSMQCDVMLCAVLSAACCVLRAGLW
eukprot:5548437-Lingulodinium_polyedra.AAC.1